MIYLVLLEKALHNVKQASTGSCCDSLLELKIALRYLSFRSSQTSLAVSMYMTRCIVAMSLDKEFRIQGMTFIWSGSSINSMAEIPLAPTVFTVDWRQPQNIACDPACQRGLARCIRKAFSEQWPKDFSVSAFFMTWLKGNITNAG